MIAAVVAVVAVAGSRCGSAQSAALSEADRAAIRQAHAEAVKAANSGNWPGWVAQFADDGAVMPPNADAVQGRAAILKWAESYPPISDFQANLVEIEGTSTIAYVRGSYSLKVTPPGVTVPIADKGKFIEIWRKQADGSWKVAHDMFNSDVPLPPPGPSLDAGKKK